MTDDRHPFALAFHRRQLLPGKDPEKYTLNKYKENIKGSAAHSPGIPTPRATLMT